MKGVLLINLGSPEHNDLDSVKKFLREFLNDKFVINLPKFIRNFIVFKSFFLSKEIFDDTSGVKIKLVFCLTALRISCLVFFKLYSTLSLEQS